jgi:hypothetical protein
MTRFLAVAAAAAVACGASAASAQSNELDRPWPEITAGQTISGTLAKSDFLRSDGTFADGFSYYARAGETVTVTLRSPDFDAWVIVDEPDGPFREWNDDGAGGTDSQLTVTFDHGGRYVIVANSVSNSTGRYTLYVSSTGGDLTKRR